MKNPLQIASVVLAAGAFAAALRPAARPLHRYWITTRPLAVGDTLAESVAAVQSTAPPAGKAAPLTSRSAPTGYAALTLPSGTLLTPNDVQPNPPSASGPPMLAVAIPLSGGSPSAKPGGRAMIMTLGTGSAPSVVAASARIVGVSNGATGTIVTVALPEPEAEAVAAAQGSGRVVVIPWLH